MVACHKFVLDACSDYFAGFLKNKILDDKNLIICLPKEIKLWEIQALLQFMYHGEVCISQEGLASLVKCAELLQVKGLCGNETTSIVSKEKDPLANTKAIEDAKVVAESNITNAEVIEADPNESDCCEYNDQMFIKKEISISESLKKFTNREIFHLFHVNQATSILKLTTRIILKNLTKARRISQWD